MSVLRDQLIEAMNSLTPENWRKGAYFQREGNSSDICMCAHGAAQAVVNPVCKLAVHSLNDVAANRAVYSAENASLVAAKIKASKSSPEIWSNRPDWVKQDCVSNGQNYGNFDIHYLMGMVGLTTVFNDATNTTLEMVKEKFQQAIELATELNV